MKTPRWNASSPSVSWYDDCYCMISIAYSASQESSASYVSSSSKPSADSDSPTEMVYGMTSEKQQQVRNAIYNVFGGTTSVKSGNDSASTAAAPAVSLADVQLESVSEDQDRQGFVEEANRQLEGDEELVFGIPCSICTLINAEGIRYCIACGSTLETFNRVSCK